ncbi:MAG TPA: TonB-dependent receptor plug domain-containing protein [Nevskiaceae bacterium]|nr:TonB-dependent receptor plug domain-containing protein [Nevskiaceae bacterium]
MKRILQLGALALGAGAACAAPAQDTPATTDDGATRLPTIVTEEKPWNFNKETRYSHLLPEVDGTAITVTKKNSVTRLDEQPTIIDNNQREVFERVPGLVIAEQQNPGQLNINYRGIGGNGALGTQESELLLSLQDGMPIASDWIGFPTTYYLPVPQSIQEIQFIRGSSGLIYGPEPAALNYVSRKPDADHALAGYSEHVTGSNALYSTFNSVSGTSGDWNYLANAHFRHADGERANGQYQVEGGDAHLGYALSSSQRLAFDFHAYSADDGEAGRMSLTQFQANPYQTTTPYDHDWVRRFTGALTHDYQPDEQLLVETKVWGGFHNQSERNQNGAGTATTLVVQPFHFVGVDSRVRMRWGRGNALTAGAVFYDSSSPMLRYSSSNLSVDPGDRSGTPLVDQQRESKYGAVFAENVFRFGRFHVVPSVRLEREVLDINEPLPPAGRAAINQAFARGVPLFGLGFGNDFGHGNETYVNISQGYRPMRFLDVAPTSASVNPSLNNPAPSKSLTYEAGVHGWPLVGLYYDFSIFQTNFTNRIESQQVGPLPTDKANVNTGDTRHRGVEGQVEYDFMKLFKPESDAHLSGFLNASYLDAEFTEAHAAGVSVGNDPSYAPHYVVREGVLWRKDRAWKFSLSAQTIGSQYWQDSNAAAGGITKIPSYTVADFGADIWLMRNLRLLGGVSNLADRTYYSRVLFGGSIEPAAGRTFYAGLSAEF